MAPPSDLETARVVLFHLSEGRTVRQILADHPELAPEDVQAAAAVALRLLETGETRDERIARVRRAHPHAFEPWSAQEDRDLVAEWRHGAGVAALSRAFGRPTGAIRIRLGKLGEDPRRKKAPE